MIPTLIAAPAAVALDWDAQVKGHLRVDSDDEETRVNTALIPAATRWCEALTGRQLITATWSFWFSSFEDAMRSARKFCKYPSETILVPRPPLQSVTWIKYYDTANVQQTLDAADYVVTTPAGPECGPGFIRPAASVTFPSTYARPDAVEIKAVCGYGAGYANVPGSLAQAMLMLVGEMWLRREEVVTGTIVAAAPFAALQLAQGFAVEV